MLKLNSRTINSILVGAFVFQFGFMQAVAAIFRSQLPVAVFSLLLLFLAFYVNYQKINIRVIYALLLITLYFFLEMIFRDDPQNIRLAVYLEFLFKSFSAFIIGSLVVKGSSLFSACKYFALLSFIVLLPHPFTRYGAMNYMRFGYAMIPTAIMFFFASMQSKSKIKFMCWLSLFFLSSFLAFIYGSRGAMLVLLIAMLFYIYFNKRCDKYISTAKWLLPVTAVVSYRFMESILLFFAVNLGISSYALTKFSMTFSRGFWEASSGRYRIYSRVMEYFQENILFGRGVAYTQVLAGSTGSTAHNVFLQILVEGGIILMIVWLCVWLYSLVKYIKVSEYENGYFEVITLIVASALGRLLFSSDMWLRPEYWLALSMLLTFSKKKTIEDTKQCIPDAANKKWAISPLC